MQKKPINTRLIFGISKLEKLSLAKWYVKAFETILSMKYFEYLIQPIMHCRFGQDDIYSFYLILMHLSLCSSPTYYRPLSYIAIEQPIRLSIDDSNFDSSACQTNRLCDSWLFGHSYYSLCLSRC